jgi:hypothetical protein
MNYDRIQSEADLTAEDWNDQLPWCSSCGEIWKIPHLAAGHTHREAIDWVALSNMVSAAKAVELFLRCDAKAVRHESALVAARETINRIERERDSCSNKSRWFDEVEASNELVRALEALMGFVAEEEK